MSVPVHHKLQAKFQEHPGYTIDFIDEVLAKEALIHILVQSLDIEENVVRSKCFFTETAGSGRGK